MMDVHETLNQMGGTGRLNCMVGAHTFVNHDDKAVSFKFKGSRIANYIKITLNSMDTYDVEIGKTHGLSYKIVAEYTDVYNDNLINIFEDITKLYLTLNAR